MTHKCPISGCTWNVADDRLMCLTHWKLVPPLVQKAVNATWRGIRATKVVQDRLTATRKYQAARDLAINHVNKLGPLL